MTSVSSSNWLDRLRSSRGFPACSEPDLDRFLSSSSSGSAPATESTHSQTAIPENRRISGAGFRINNEFRQDDVSNVICDLFNMGKDTSRTFSKKKSSRKQANPRFFRSANDEKTNNINNELCSSDDLRRDRNGLGDSSGDNSLNAKNAEFEVDVDEIRDDVFDLKGYSRNEVLVVDTSLPDGKFDGWVFRKDDEWKIKEKKGKGRVCGGKKKRKLVGALNGFKNESLHKHDDDHQKMKNNNGVSFLLLDKGQPQIEKKETTDSVGKIPQKRCPCPRPPEKFGNENSSVKLIALNNMSESPILGKSSQKKCPKQMNIL